MRFGVLHRLPMPADLAVGTDDDSRADRSLDFLAVHHLLSKRAVRAHRLRVGIGEQREIYLVAVAKFFVRGDAVLADAQNDGADLLRLFAEIAEAARLFGAARGIVLGIKIQDDGLTGVVVQLVPFSIAAFEIEFGGLLPFQVHPLTS